MTGTEQLLQAAAVSVSGRALLIEGKPGSGKSSLALALIDRGATLIGDDGVKLVRDGGRVVATPPPNIAGKLEVRGVGIVDLPVTSAPLSLILAIDPEAPRYPEELEARDILSTPIPVLPFKAGDAVQALRAEWALAEHGIKESTWV